MIETNKTSSKKVSRGRPKKEFVSKKPIIKRDKPGRPKKDETIIEEMIPEIVAKTIVKQSREEKKNKENKQKDRFILRMFLFSLFLFGLSFYLSRENDSILSISETDEIINTGLVDTISGQNISGEVVDISTNTGIQNTNINTNNSELTDDSNAGLINNFYELFNKASLLPIYPNIDGALLNTKTFKKFFGKTRIERFLRNISTEGVTISKIESDNQANPTYTYQISYTLKDGKYFEETRQIKILSKDTPKIGSIKCVSTGCSTLPFMNPGKYKLQ